MIIRLHGKKVLFSSKKIKKRREKKKTSRESIFEANYSSLVIVSKADTFDNKAPKEKMLFSF